MRFPELEKVLIQHYPFLNSGWVVDEFPETGDICYSTECDNFPVLLDDLTLYLEAVFWVVPDKKVFLVEAYTTLFEDFPQPPAFLNETEFLGQLANKQFLTDMITRLAENPLLTPQNPTEIERLYFFGKTLKKSMMAEEESFSPKKYEGRSQ